MFKYVLYTTLITVKFNLHQEKLNLLHELSILATVAFLYTNNKKSERAIKESIPFTIATKIIKYLGINLPKGTKELSTENCKTLVKEIIDDINIREIFHVTR